MKPGKIRCLLLFWTVCFGICLPDLVATRACAALMVTYDLDSLVYMSSEIVEGRFVRRPFRGQEHDGVAEVELTAVYKGDLKPGQTITVAYLDPYVVGDLDTRHRSFEHGDVLFLFLNPVTAREAFNRLPAGRTYHGVVESGVKLMQKNRVLTFVQLEDPGPYGLMPPSPDSPAPLPSVPEFQQSIAKSIPAMEQIQKRFAGKRSIADGPWLLELLHRPDEGEINDFLKNLAVDRISDLHDLPLLKRAAALLPTGIYAGDLGTGYAFPEGREYLLASVADPGLPMSERMRDARFLEGTGGEYDVTVTEIHSPHPGGSSSGKRTEPPAKGNAQYLTRMAGLAWKFADDKELCGAILGSLDYLVQETSADDQAPGVQEDRAGVMPVVRKLAATAKAKENRDEAQRIVTILLHPPGPH